MMNSAINNANQHMRRTMAPDSRQGLPLTNNQNTNGVGSSSNVATVTPNVQATPRIRPTLQNVVSTVVLGCQLDLKKVALSARNAEYNPKRFSAVIMRVREPKTTALIFASGKMVVTGAKNEALARTAARKFARIVQKTGFPAKFKEFRIQNIVGSCDVRFPIRLERLNVEHHTYSSYEPELFPGLIYRMVEPKILNNQRASRENPTNQRASRENPTNQRASRTNPISSNINKGARSPEDIQRAFEQIEPVLRQFRGQSDHERAADRS